MADNEEIQGLAVRLSLEDSSFEQGRQNLMRQIGIIDSQFKASVAGLKDWGKNLDSLKANAQALSDKINVQKQVVKSYQDQLAKANKDLEEHSQQLVELNKNYEAHKAKIDAAKTAWQQSKAALGENDEATKKLEKEYKDLNDQYKNAENLVLRNQKSVQGYTIQLNNAKAQQANMESQLRNTNTEIAKQSSSWTKLSKDLGNASKAMKDTGDKMTTAGKSMSLIISAPILAAGVASTKMAMDAIESENLFEVSMGNMADSARKWSVDLRNQLGLNDYAVRQNVATFNVMFDSMGIGTQAALDMSEGLTQLAYDMASFYNMSPEQAFEKLKSGISGETEPLKALGIIINDTTVKTYAYSEGIVAQGQELTEQEKVLARYQLIMKNTSKAQGDLARTIDFVA